MCQLGAVGPGEQTSSHDLELAQSQAFPPVVWHGIVEEFELGLAANQRGARFSRFATDLDSLPGERSC